ncbi:MAG: ImmA/IrrE family metallo-endopeptidase [Deltaproteobacteria bacterium]|jgi:Zn-dependent peptidase ImmA (M78 family)|nr:ImmA/IrrE family metallo-endopeptidase [Deltaproteobacteria bacterium]
MMNGIVGSNPRRSLNLEEFRAFTLIDEYAPLIFINAKDSTAGRIFSLIHELVHLGLGINSLFYDDRTSDINGYTGTERICNAVAAEILVPIESFKVMWEKYSKYDISSKITQLAKDFKISEAVIARRAFDLNYISHAIYNEMITNMIHKPKNITKRGGGDAIKTFLSRIDHNFFKTISQCVRTGHLLYTDAYRLTGLSRIFFDKATDIFEG